MLTVEEAMQLLKNMPPKAVLVVGGYVVEGIEGPVRGRLKEGHIQPSFTPVEKGRELAVYLTRAIEQSDGVVRECRI